MTAREEYEKRYAHISRNQTADRGVARCVILADAALAEADESLLAVEIQMGKDVQTALDRAAALKAKLAEADEKLAQARVGELEAMNVLEGTELKLAQAETALAHMTETFQLAMQQRDAAEERVRELEERSCESCVRPCDTVDESNYEGHEPFYCARFTAPEPKEEK